MKKGHLPQTSMFDEIIVDNFAGGGGASTGIEFATGRVVSIAINAPRFRLPARMRRWIKRHKKPCRAALIAANQAMCEEIMILRQSNDCLMKENIRLRMLLNGVE